MNVEKLIDGEADASDAITLLTSHLSHLEGIVGTLMVSDGNVAYLVNGGTKELVGTSVKEIREMGELIDLVYSNYMKDDDVKSTYAGILDQRMRVGYERL